MPSNSKNSSKFQNVKDIQDWAALYNDFYLFKNNEHNIHFWQVTKAETFKDAEKLLKRNFNWKDIKDGYGGGMKYLDWWDKDCQNAAMSENKPVDWMKKRIMKNKMAPEYFENKESNMQKKSNGNDLKVDEEKDFIETKVKKEKPAFSKNKKSKSNSPLPPWLPFITIPLIFLISTSINNSRRQQMPTTPVGIPPGTGGGGNLDICQLCRITNSCDTLPQCTSSQKICEWKQTWDGKLVQECKSF